MLCIVTDEWLQNIQKDRQGNETYYVIHSAILYQVILSAAPKNTPKANKLMISLWYSKEILFFYKLGCTSAIGSWQYQDW